MRLIVLASRNFDNMLTIEDIDIAIKKLKLKPTVIVCTDNEGPEELGAVWAEEYGVPVDPKEAKWDLVEGCKTVKTNKWGKKYNYMAGFERNQAMVDSADAVLIFWDIDSPSVTDIITRAKKKDIPIHYIKPNPEYFLE